MEKELNLQLTGELTAPQFRQQLNQWFEEHGVIDNLRSHLRSLMITALQHTEISLKSHHKMSPKAQSIDLLVAEYLLKHGCHYTLSVLVSELPCLANFGSGTLYLHRGPNAKSKIKRHFQESEMIEILNCLGLPSNAESNRNILTYYNQNKEEKSLLECLLRLLEPEENFQRLPEDENTKPNEEDHEKRKRELAEREKRIRQYLKSHEEEILKRLQLAEKDLDASRETIDKELAERQLHLERIAIQWKHKHQEIMTLSKHFAALKNENKSLRDKLDNMEAEMSRLTTEIREKTEVIELLEAEKMLFKTRIREYLKLANKDGGENLSNQTDVCPVKLTSEGNYLSTFAEGKKKYEDLNSSGSLEERFSLSETFPAEEALLERAKFRLHVLEEETSRISEKYLKYRKKYEDDLSLSCEMSNVVEENYSKKSDVKEDAMEKEGTINVSTKEAAQQVNMENDPIQIRQETPIKRKVTHTEEKTVPTRRQEENRQFYLRSRQFLEILEKSTGLIEYTSGSSTDVSQGYSSSGESLKSMVKDEEEKVVENNSVRKLEDHVERKDKNLTDLECLSLLQKATHTNLKAFESQNVEITLATLNRGSDPHEPHYKINE